MFVLKPAALSLAQALSKKKIASDREVFLA